jgi:hypothetical protein
MTKRKNRFAFLFPAGLGAGVAIGAAIGNIGVGLVIGVAIGTTLSLAGELYEQRARNDEGDSDR